MELTSHSHTNEKVGPEDFELLKVLGQGSFGKVNSVRFRLFSSIRLVFLPSKLSLQYHFHDLIIIIFSEFRCFWYEWSTAQLSANFSQWKYSARLPLRVWTTCSVIYFHFLSPVWQPYLMILCFSAAIILHVWAICWNFLLFLNPNELWHVDLSRQSSLVLLNCYCHCQCQLSKNYTDKLNAA